LKTVKTVKVVPTAVRIASSRFQKTGENAATLH